MSTYDNPAGRLHALLQGLSEQPQTWKLIRAWAVVLGVEQEDVPLHLGAVGQLVRDVRSSVQSTEKADAFLPLVERHRGAWSNPIFPRNTSFNTKVSDGGVLPDAEALVDLNVVSAYLQDAAPDGRVPNAEPLKELQNKIHELLADVKTADDLPVELRQEILARLRGVEHAIDHIQVGGPKAVRLAMEAVIGAVACRDPGAFTKWAIVKGVGATMAVGWTLFTAPAEMPPALEAWNDLGHFELLSARAKVVDADVVDEDERQPAIDTTRGNKPRPNQRRHPKQTQPPTSEAGPTITCM